MILSKIICSLPLSYNSVTIAWANVPITQQIVDVLEERLIRHETLLKTQGSINEVSDKAFFTKSWSFCQTYPQRATLKRCRVYQGP